MRVTVAAFLKMIGIVQASSGSYTDDHQRTIPSNPKDLPLDGFIMACMNKIIYFHISITYFKVTCLIRLCEV